MKKIFYLSLFVILTSCSSGQEESPLSPYMEESANLTTTSYDSVCSFAEKFYNFTKSGEYAQDPLYRPIVTNIDSSKSYFLNQSCGIQIDTIWAGETVININETDEWGQ